MLAQDTASDERDRSKSTSSTIELATKVGSTGTIEVFAATFNAKEWIPTAAMLRGLLRHPSKYQIYAVGFQALSGLDSQGLAKLMEEVLGTSFVCLSSVSMHGLHLIVMLHIALATLIQADVESDSVFFGIDVDKARKRRKGAIGISFQIQDRSLMFCNAHLTGKRDNLAARNANYLEITHRLKLPAGTHHGSPIADRFDFCFFMGDLNYRIDKIEEARFMELLNDANFEALHVHDQLLLNTSAFQGFSEGHLAFPPTFRYVVGTDRYDIDQRHIPSWTDRILYSTQSDCRVINYDSYDNISESSHRPVWAAFELRIAEPDALWDAWYEGQSKLVARLNDGAKPQRAGAHEPRVDHKRRDVASAHKSAASPGQGTSTTCAVM